MMMTVKSSISLTDEQGVDLLRRQMEDEALERDALAAVMAQRRSGAFVSRSEMDARLMRMLDKKRQTHAVRD